MAIPNQAFALLTALLGIAISILKAVMTPEPGIPDAAIVRETIEGIFLESWSDYAANAWGKDIYKPISHKSKNMSPNGKPLGWIVVDSLDTMFTMYNTTLNDVNATDISISRREDFHNAILKAEDWIANELNFDIDAEVNVFETTIRMLGGLLSAHHFSTELNVGNPKIYLNKAIDLGNRLSKSIESSSNGIPFSSINLKTGKPVPNHVDNGASSTAEFTTLQMEFKYLSYLTGNDKYWKLSEKVYPPLYNNNNLTGEQYDGLVPIYTFPNTGKFFGNNIRVGSRADSFYEYLLKQYLLTGEKLYYNLYRISIEGIKKHLIDKTTVNGLYYVGEKEDGLEGELSPKMDHLVCFLGGVLAMGATEGYPIDIARQMEFWDETREEDWTLAHELTFTCYQMYDQMPSDLAPEIAIFENGQTHTKADTWYTSFYSDFFVKPMDAHNLQRPETVESLMFMYHLSGLKQYRTWGYQILEGFLNNAAVVDDGDRTNATRRFTSLDNVYEIPTVKRDNLESFWMAETLKYFHLLFQDDVDLTSVVFNTEAHPFPVFDQEKMDKIGLTTGWSL